MYNNCGSNFSTLSATQIGIIGHQKAVATTSGEPLPIKPYNNYDSDYYTISATQIGIIGEVRLATSQIFAPP